MFGLPLLEASMIVLPGRERGEDGIAPCENRVGSGPGLEETLAGSKNFAGAVLQLTVVA